MTGRGLLVSRLHVVTIARHTSGAPRNIAKGFLKFISRNNVIQLSIAVVMGGAFNAVVNSIVFNAINPLIGLIWNSNLENWYVAIKGYNGIDYATPLLANQNKIVTLNLGAVFSSVITFFIVVLVCFGMAKTLQKYLQNNFKDDDKRDCTYCFESIKAKAFICYRCKSKNPFFKSNLSPEESTTQTAQ